MENKFKSLESVIREMAMNRNSKIRMKDVENVDRETFNKRNPKHMDDNVMSPKSELAKQGEIKTKIIDEKKKVEKEDVMFGKGPPDNMSSPSNSQTPVTTTTDSTPKMPNVWNNTPSMFQPKMPKITEAKDKNFDDVEVTDKKNSTSPSSKKTKPADSEDHDLDDAKKVKGGTTEVELNPKTDDKVNSETDEDDSAKKGRKKANKEIGQKGAPMKEEVIFEGYHVKDHPVFGKVLAKDGNTHLVNYDTADKISDKHKGSSVIKTMDRKKYIVKMPEHMKHGQQVEVEGY